MGGRSVAARFGSKTLSWQPPDMCGIAGTFNFTPTQPIDPERLAAMTAVTAHRGPKADGLGST